MSPSSSSSTISELLNSLLRLSRDISAVSAATHRHLLRFSAAVARKSYLLSLLFEELLLLNSFKIPNSAALCLAEILIVLQKFKALLADTAARSRTRLLLQSEIVANEFHELSIELSTLLDILPLSQLGVSKDIEDITILVSKQCRRSKPGVEDSENSLRKDVLSVIKDVELEIVPDRARLLDVMTRLGFENSRDCRDEIEILEREIGDRAVEKWSEAMVALVGLFRYAKCVLFGASTPRSVDSGNNSKLSPFSGEVGGVEVSVPADFRCPISLDVMRDPVVVATGQTYDRDSITKWIGSGHATCPNSGQALTSLELVPNRALKNLIAQWCKENNFPFVESNGVALTKSDVVSKNCSNASQNKAAQEAARMTATFLVENLASSSTPDAANRVVHELRQLAKCGSDNRSFVAEAGAIPLLLPLLFSEEAGLQVNAITALLNLSILEANKKRIMHTDGAVDGVVHVLANGATWRAKENAAATVLSLSSVHSYRRRLGRHPLVIEQLVKLVRTGPASTKKDAMAAILSLSGDRENTDRLVKGEALVAAMEALVAGDVADEAVAVVASIAKRGGAEAVWGVEGVVGRLAGVLRRGSDWARENAAAALVVVCRRAGAEAVAELAAVAGIEWVIWELMGGGASERARRKAASLGRICRKWAAAVEAERTARTVPTLVAVAP